MNAPVRVMIVDDSSVVRKLLTAALAMHPEVEVIGSAANGLIALHKLPQLNPDAVILDVEMPEMDGITTLSNLRESYPRLPVIMFSTLTERGANVTFDALAAGASDYVLKPSTQNGETLESVVANALVPKLLALTRSRFGLALQAAIASASADTGTLDASKVAPVRHTIGPALKPSLGASPLAKGLSPTFAPRGQPKPILSPALTARPGILGGAAPSLAPSDGKKGSSPSQAPQPLNATPNAARGTADGNFAAALNTRQHALLQRAVGGTAAQPLMRKPIQIIAIAASTGGPNALAEVLPRLPGSLPVPIVVVQHMPPIFTRCLADRLSARSELKIVESEGGERLLPGHVYIAPGNRHLELARDGEGVVYTSLTDGPPENSCRPAADVLFRSVARLYGGSVLCAVLTGMGHDGLRGAREIRDAGGRVVVQSGPTCVIWGMPKVVEEAGLAEAVVPLPEMAAALLQRVGLGLLPVRAPEGAR